MVGVVPPQREVTSRGILPHNQSGRCSPLSFCPKVCITTFGLPLMALKRFWRIEMKNNILQN